MGAPTTNTHVVYNSKHMIAYLTQELVPSSINVDGHNASPSPRLSHHYCSYSEPWLTLPFHIYPSLQIPKFLLRAVQRIQVRLNPDPLMEAAGFSVGYPDARTAPKAGDRAADKQVVYAA